MRARGFIAIAALLLGVVSVAACDGNRLLLPGDVRDTEGRAISGCKVELVVHTPLVRSWTGYVAREAITDPAGPFSFDVFVVRAADYRIRIAHPGYQEWLIQSRWPSTPTRYHITLLRQVPDRVPPS